MVMPMLAPAPAALVAASSHRRDPRTARLLHLDPRTGSLADLDAAEGIPALLGPGDVLVVNDAATLPASLPLQGGLELRLLAHQDGTRWLAVLFGAGDWRQDTDSRPPPPAVAPGSRLALQGAALEIAVEAVDVRSPRLLTVRLGADPEAMWAAIYAVGRPVQYSYLREPVPLAAVQNVYAGAPWAAEMPSAGRVLTAAVLRRLRDRGVRVVALTHAAGLSATGDAALDAALPLPERYHIPEATAAAVRSARRVIAAGTSVVRALEDSGGVAGDGIATLRLAPHTQPRVVHGVLSNMHSPGESHFELLAAFAGEALLARAGQHAAARGYLAHEFGDVTLILGSGRNG